MDNAIVAFDEAGNTGQNLVDPQQPDVAPRDRLWHELNDRAICDLITATLWPSDKVTPEDPDARSNGGTNPADAMAEYLAKQSELDK